MQWDSSTKKSNVSISTNKDGIHSIDISIAIKAKIMTLMSKTETLETPSALQIGQLNQQQTPICFNCKTLNYVMEESKFI